MKTLTKSTQIPLTDLTHHQVKSPILRVEGLSKAFGGQQVLDSVSVTLHQGEVVLLRGANGSGKTTLLNLLTGNLQPDAGVIKLSINGVSEQFRFPLPWWEKLNPWNHFTPERVAHTGVGRTWQDIRLFNTQTLLNNIAVATPQQWGENPFLVLLKPYQIKQQERLIRHDAHNRLAQLGLSGREKSSADKVSLGQSKRVAIARAVQAGAKILFLDEPLAGLDANGVTEVMALLQQLAHQEQVTLVIVEHIFNLSRILELATTVWTLEEGKLTTAQAVKTIQNPQIRNHNSIEGWLQNLAGIEGTIKEQKLTGGARLSILQTEGVKTDLIGLEVEDLVIYRGKRLVIGERGEDGKVKGLYFTLSQGELGVLQAPNGWGKTTLLEAIAGLLPIHRGIIRLMGKPIQDLSVWERVRSGLSFLQSRDNVFPNLTVREVCKLAQVKEIPKSVRGLLSKKMSNLSGGEKQKVVLACAINGKAFQVGMLDEPFTALDLEAVKQIEYLLSTQLRDVGLLIAIPKIVEDVYYKSNQEA